MRSIRRKGFGFPVEFVGGPISSPAEQIQSPVGSRFGMLVITGKANRGWMCRCDCGNYRKVPLSVLTKGGLKTCGCRKLRRDLIGRRFGQLTVMATAGRGWMLCKCDCGAESAIQIKLLNCGRARSCGCRMRKNLSGQKFGHLTVLHVLPRKFDAGRGQRRWLAHCDCGNEIMVAAKSLMSGNTRSCGCLRQMQSRINEYFMARTPTGQFSCVAI
jgi:hypothetical protein